MTWSTRRLAMALAAVAAGTMPPAVAMAKTVSDDDRPLQVIDADGKVVGRYVAGPAVIAVVGGDRVQLPLQIGPAVGTVYSLTWADSGATLFFETADCQGAALVYRLGTTAAGTRYAIVSASATAAWLYLPESIEPHLVDGTAPYQLAQGVCQRGGGSGATYGVTVRNPPIDLFARFRLPLTIR